MQLETNLWNQLVHFDKYLVCLGMIQFCFPKCGSGPPSLVLYCSTDQFLFRCIYACIILETFNKMSRLNGKAGDREKVFRELKKIDTSIIEDMRVYKKAYGRLCGKTPNLIH